jgi:hypothetical protein
MNRRPEMGGAPSVMSEFATGIVGALPTGRRMGGFPVSRDEMLPRLAEAGVSARRGIMAAYLEPACTEFSARGAPGNRTADDPPCNRRHPR